MRGDDDSCCPTISADGRYVAFESLAGNLAPGDGNGICDTYLHDRVTGTTTLVSQTPGGLAGDDESYPASVSRDGRYVTFESLASDLVPGDTNDAFDMFVRDLVGGTTERASVTFAGLEGNSDSGEGGGDEGGRWVAFASLATNLVAAPDTNGNADVFVRGALQPCAPVTYCAAKINSLGCSPAIGSRGCPSAAATSGFHVEATQVRNRKSGLLFYGTSGRANLPFQGGTLCVSTPLKRTPVVNSGGSPAPHNSCNGVFSLDVNAFARGLLGGTPLPALTAPGTQVNCQWWGRDPAPGVTTLSDGLEYVVQP